MATEDYRMLPYVFALKAEALRLAHRSSEALTAIREAEALANDQGALISGIAERPTGDNLPNEHHETKQCDSWS
jgi:hypothetical protein